MSAAAKEDPEPSSAQLSESQDFAEDNLIILILYLL